MVTIETLEGLYDLLEKIREVQASLGTLPKSPERDQAIESVGKVVRFIEDRIDFREMLIHNTD